jgi:hypothetical protein
MAFGNLGPPAYDEDVFMSPPSIDSDSVRSSTLLELGPDLPIGVFTSAEPWHAERIGALALYCSDGRWGEAFDEFLPPALGDSAV